ncbi:MAG: LAGLIDADG family homing endonuclease [Candidatus Pacearchaeota archaeon]
MALDQKEKSSLEEFLERMRDYRARHTELITVYVSKGYDINFITRQLESEKSTAANIKSTSTRKNVQDALESLIRITKSMKQTPKNGVALFAGNVSKIEGQDNFITEVFEPPEELNVRLYRCDQTFVLDPLDEMLEVKEVYGLMVVERQEAAIGLLIGKKIKVLKKITSMIPGKTNKGGQCLSPDTFIMRDNGEIIEIKDSHNPLFIVSENLNEEKTEKTPVIEKWENDKELFKIITKCPRMEIKASKDHLFFVRTEQGIEEKPLAEIKEGDFLIMPSKLDISGELQKINFQLNKIKKTKEIIFPEFLDNNLAKVLGYYLGDGNWEEYRICFSEQREELACYYKGLLEGMFKIPCSLRFREDKNYYQLRIHNLYLAQFFREFFPLKNKTLEEQIPNIIFKSPDNILASFISGFFDAEGYVSSSRIGLGVNNKKIIRQLQFALLRFGIISSFHEYDNRANLYSNNPRYTLEISCLESLKKFYQLIGFSSLEKTKKLFQLIENRGNQENINQLIVNGKEVAKIIKNSGEQITKFHCPMFFANQRQMSKEVFKRKILDKIENLDLKKRLEFFYNSNLILAKINKIEPIGQMKTIDIETKSHNFIANCLLVHNSAARYSRIRDNMAKDFYRKIAEIMKDEFFHLKELQGILVGGPGPTKEDFLKEGNLVTALKEKVIAVKDIGYADEHGLDLLVECSQDVLGKQEIIYEKKVLEKFFNMLGKSRDKTAYGKEEVQKALDYGAVEVLFLSKKLKREDIKAFEKKAGESSVDVELISMDTEEGQQFWNLGGVGAILRFKI